jgi:hypothetical protein
MTNNYVFFSTYPEFINCDVIAIPTKYDFKPYAYGFQKDSPYLDLFNFYIKELREKGVLKQILKKHESQSQICPDYSGKSLGFGSCFTAFVILIAGLCLGLCLFTFETCAHYFGCHITLWNYGTHTELNPKNFRNICDNQKLEILSLKAKVKDLESQMIGKQKYPYDTNYQ